MLNPESDIMISMRAGLPCSIISRLHSIKIIPWYSMIFPLTSINNIYIYNAIVNWSHRCTHHIHSKSKYYIYILYQISWYTMIINGDHSILITSSVSPMFSPWFCHARYHQVLAGPSVGQFFAELGADVIKAVKCWVSPGKMLGAGWTAGKRWVKYAGKRWVKYAGKC